VQLALIAGMRVAGVAGTEAKRQAVLALGAANAFNHRQQSLLCTEILTAKGLGGAERPR
jgi:NADPH-dependent curcumin reductase CurA